MAKRKKVKVDNKTYNINSPEYKKLYSEGIMSVDSEGIPNYYSPEEATVTAKRINPIEEAVRRGRGKFATGIAQGAGAMGLGIGEMMNTPLALLTETLSGRGDYKSALPSMERILSNVGVKGYDYKGNDQLTPGALVSDNPYIQMGIDIPVDIATGKAVSKYSPKIIDYLNDIYQTSKVNKKLSIPKYQDVYRWQPDKVPNWLIESGKKELTPEQQALTGSWYMKNPNLGFYLRTRPGSGTLLHSKLPEYKIKELQENMPRSAKGMSGKVSRSVADDYHPDELVVPKQYRNKNSKPIKFDVNPSEYLNQSDEWQKTVNDVISKYGDDVMSSESNFYKTLYDNYVDDFLKNITKEKHDKKLLNIIPSKYSPFENGGKITNNMKKKKNKNLLIDNGLPKAAFGLEMLIPMLGNIGAGVGAASGATSGLAGAGGGGLGSLGANAAGGLGTATGAGAGLQSLGSTAAGSVSGSTGGASAFGGASKGMQSMNPLGPLANATMQAVNNMIKSFEPEEEIRPVLKNTGAHYANGGEINIKPSKRGTFTAAAKKRGKGVQEFASQVLANKDNYSPAMVKKANFARNAAKWKKAMGGLVDSSYMDVFDAMGYGGNVFDNPEYSDYMALGGITGGPGDPTLPPLNSKATRSDSLNAFNNSLKLQKYYEGQGYQSQGKTKNPIKEPNVFKRELDRLYGQFQNQQSTTYPTASGGSASGKLDPKYYRKPTNPNTPNIIEQRESQFGTLNTRAPFGYYDTRIVPPVMQSYKNVNMRDPLRGDEVNIPIYDVSVKPYSMRTPAEQAYVEKMYGKPQTPVSIPTPVAEVKPMTMEQRLETNRPSTVNNVTPVSDLRPSAKKYFEKYRKEGDPALADRDEALYRKFLQSGVLTGDEAVNLGVPGVLQRARSQKAMGGMIDPLMAFGGMIDPSMYMEQMMYGSYAQGGQVPQNIPVEVEGEEMYELPDGQTGEFQGPKHENGGIPIALPEGTKIYSDRLKVDGKTMAQRKEKRDNNIKKLEKLLTKNPSDRFIKEAIKRQQETASLEEQGDMQMQEQANQQQAMQEQMMEEMLMGAAQEDIQQGMMAMGGMIKRADGSYSQRGLWDNIRANRGSGKRPTKEMLKQEKKIRAAEKAMGGLVKYGDGTSEDGIPNTNFLNFPELGLNARYKIPYGESLVTPYIQDYADIIPTETIDGVEYKLMEDVEYDEQGNPMRVIYNDVNAPSSNTLQNINPKVSDDVALYNKLNYIGNVSKKPIIRLSEDIPVSIQQDSQKEDRSGFDFSGIFGNFGGGKKEKTPKTGGTTKSTTGDNVRYTEGDRMGMMGNLIGMFGPSAMTMLNRLETPKNKNFFREFGQEALRTQVEAEGIAGMAKDEAYRKNLMRANALRKQLANSARGVGDMRTGQLTAALAEQEGGRDILGSYLQSMSGLKGQRAQLQQQIDQTRMGGEYQRDLADRQDIDQFYTNLAENLATASEFTQKQGKDMNTALRNKHILQASKYYSAYGIYADIDEQGNFVLRDDSTGKTITEKEAREKKKKMDDEAKKAASTTASTTPTTKSE
jgi:hypothetical protein